MLILATGSSYKRQLMERLGLEFQTEAADIDESSLSCESPHATARRLARKKAGVIAEENPEAFVIGADQIISLDDERLTKPGNAVWARKQLRRLSGRTHQLSTAVAVAAPDREPLSIFAGSVDFEMTMRDLTDDEIHDYVSEDQPLDCAGSYKIEAGGIRLFRKLRGDDYTAIIGLPLTLVRSLLEQAGYFDETS